MDTDRIAPKPPVSVRPGGIGHLDRGAIQILMLTLIAVVLVVAALDLASAIVVPSVMAVLAAIALAPLARQVEKLRVPASVAAAVIVAGLVFSSVAMIYALLPSAEAWNARAPQVIREIELRVRHINVSFLDSIGATAKDVPEQSVTDGTTNPADVAPKPEEEKPVEDEDAIGKLVGDGQGVVADWAISAPGIVASAVYWAVLTFFLLRDRKMLGRKLLALGLVFSVRRALGRAMQDVQSDVASYLLAVTLINVALGFFVAGAFYLFGLPNAALWGVAAGVLNFMPFIGAAIMALITLGVGLVSFDEPLIALFLLAVVVGLNTIEGQIVTPMIIASRIRLPAIGIFVSIAFGAWLWGAMGALVATPTLIVCTAFLTRLSATRRAGRRD